MSDPILPTQFTRESARRIAQVVRSSELTPLPASPLRFDRAEVFKAKIFRVGTFEGAWPIGTENTVTFKNITSTPNTVAVQNLFFPVDFQPAGERDCAVAKDGTAWYLVDMKFKFEPSVAFIQTDSVQVFTGAQTQQITIYSTSATSVISTYTSTSVISVVSGMTTQSSTISYLEDIEATLNQDTCEVELTKTTGSQDVVTLVQFETASVVAVSGSPQTSVAFSSNSTQKITILKGDAPQSVTVISGVQTALLLTLNLFE